MKANDKRQWSKPKLTVYGDAADIIKAKEPGPGDGFAYAHYPVVSAPPG